jgi:predicted DNA-binding protein with PD1-like motif
MPVKNDISFAFRLFPGADLKNAIGDFVKQKNIRAGWIVSCAGSLTNYSIRFANQPMAFVGSGHFEIVSLTGTVSINGLHLHISISDNTGKTIGGHLMEGCKIYTTAEIILIESGKYIFNRVKDGSTPWEELQIINK